ncbi:hypothetical protein E1264_28525 [Actinomadura sp. KC216]|uniref:hypothetical protein n=1 Tax=Actinomadura sp. KC216 TaxID=2530370 RepID=UPI00104F138C|nr:hypothetical protein [Actinomadura sp. KC216]TDB83426.1 hypothetical protein E1264_28525 [Actinomadura sp. KC216]
MGELTVREDQAPDTSPPTPTPAPVGPVSELAAWAYDAEQAHRIATSLAKTSFVPASLRGKPFDIAAAILTGQELGLRPMASLRAMDVIQGTPALRAHAMRGLVQAQGHAVQLVESSDTRCVMRGRRHGDDEWQTVTWTIERAQRLGLTGKDQWKKQPQTMLIARATGEICRLIAADVLYAAPYVAEELDGAGRPAPTYAAEPVTAAEILAGDEPDDEPEPPGESEPVDPDADAAAQLADETGGWPPVRKPGSGA